MTVTEIVGIVSTGILFITSIVLPIFVYLKAKKKAREQRDTVVDELPKTINEIHVAIKDVKSEVKEIKKKQDLMDQHLDTFETQNLKYMINDAYFGYDCVEDIPYEILLSAAQNCDLYIGKKLNHEIGARCNIIYHELERRQSERNGGNKHD